MMCIFCKEEIQDGDKVFYIGLDIPYINLKTHYSCFREHKHNVNEFLRENALFTNALRS
jgi:hypothetical protein